MKRDLAQYVHYEWQIDQHKKNAIGDNNKFYMKVHSSCTLYNAKVKQ